ncbi:MAG TPA: hypothetical protein VNN76_06925 [Bacteroidota bacterium]|nr:hypothetical protein [Bacteroidota bacterium]
MDQFTLKYARIFRALRNLVNAYMHENNEANMQLISELLESFDSEAEES